MAGFNRKLKRTENAGRGRIMERILSIETILNQMENMKASVRDVEMVIAKERKCRRKDTLKLGMRMRRGLKVRIIQIRTERRIDQVVIKMIRLVRRC